MFHLGTICRKANTWDIEHLLDRFPMAPMPNIRERVERNLTEPSLAVLASLVNVACDQGSPNDSRR
jgi:hypothetical protein